MKEWAGEGSKNKQSKSGFIDYEKVISVDRKEGRMQERKRNIKTNNGVSFATKDRIWYFQTYAINA